MNLFYYQSTWSSFHTMASSMFVWHVTLPSCPVAWVFWSSVHLPPQFHFNRVAFLFSIFFISPTLLCRLNSSFATTKMSMLASFYWLGVENSYIVNNPLLHWFWPRKSAITIRSTFIPTDGIKLILPAMSSIWANWLWYQLAPSVELWIVQWVYTFGGLWKTASSST